MTDHSLERDRAALVGADLGRSEDADHEPLLRERPRGRGAEPVDVARRRFFRHRLAVVSLVVLIVIFGAGLAAPWVAPYTFEGYDINNLEAGPTLRGGQCSAPPARPRLFQPRPLRDSHVQRVAFLVAVLAVVIGTAIGTVAGYYGRWADNLLDAVHRSHPHAPGARGPTRCRRVPRQGHPVPCRVIVALLLWTLLARIVRGQFLSFGKRSTSMRPKPRAGDLRSCSATCCRTRSGRSSSSPPSPRRRDPPRGVPLVPRLRRSTADARPREADRGRTGRLLPRLVARHLPRTDDRARRALHQLRR